MTSPILKEKRTQKLRKQINYVLVFDAIAHDDNNGNLKKITPIY